MSNKLLFFFFLCTCIVMFFSGCGNKYSISQKSQKSKDNISVQIKQELVSKDKVVKKIEEEKKKLDTKTPDVEISFEEDIEGRNVDISSNLDETRQYVKFSKNDIYKLDNAKECLKLYLKHNDKLECIRSFERYILEEKSVLKLEDCKRLLTRSSKLKCFDKIYFNLASKRRDKKYCSLINDKKIKQKCIDNITLWKKTVFTLQKKEDINKNKDNLNNIYDVDECLSLGNNDIKFNCIDKFVKKDKDLRYCFKYLSGVYKRKCINENYNDILKYDLKLAVETNNSNWCEKIGIDERVKKCKRSIGK